MRSLGFALLALTLASGCRTEDAQPERTAEEPRPEIAAVAQPTQEVAAAAPSTASSGAPAPAAATTSARRGSGDALTVRRLVVATDVERVRREPVGAATRFTKGEFEKIFAFVEVENRGDPAALVVSFEPPAGGANRGNVTLEVDRSSRWRTWAFSRGVDRPGRWVAVVRTTDGRELARQEFEVVPVHESTSADVEGRHAQRPGHTAPS